jgi:hypothetical protein
MRQVLSIFLGVLLIAGFEAFVKTLFTWEWFLTLGKRRKQIE